MDPFICLTINAGSSSLKFSVFDTSSNKQIFEKSLERIASVEEAAKQIPSILAKAGVKKLDAIGHRVAHGGEKFHDARIITPEVLADIEECVPLAPLHNPPALAGIKIATETWPDVVQVAVFDTAFHQTMPEKAYIYALPKKWRDTNLRRYGFHGTSHKYVMLRVSEELKTPAENLRIISCHLGSGASICAIEYGKSVDTSMGMTPLEGLIMGTRSGDVDPGLFMHLKRTLNLTEAEVEHGLYHESGLLGMSGISDDMRDVELSAMSGNKSAQVAIQAYAYRVQKYIASYAAAMGGVDVIIFTGGIGENDAFMRRRICQKLEFMGLDFDEDKNSMVSLEDSQIAEIQSDNSRIKVVVTRTKEQWMMAQDMTRVLRPIVTNDTPVIIPTIPVAVSARHIHLTQEYVEKLFGKGYQLHVRHQLSQPGFWSSEETLDVVGPRGTLSKVRVLGPCRDYNQVEVAETETYILGIEAPVRLSGNVKNTPEVTLRSSTAEVEVEGLIVAKRHIHMSTADGEKYGLKHGDEVDVAVQSGDRGLVFRNVVIRLAPTFVLEMHIDTDEANAANIEHGGTGGVLNASGCNALVTHIKQAKDPDRKSYGLK